MGGRLRSSDRPPRRAPGGHRRRSRGAVLVLVLLQAALVAAAAMMTLEWASHAQQREREAEVLRIGEEMRRAIVAYYFASPGTRREFPRALEDLVLDRRQLVTRRYLRRVYVDPLTGQADWGLVRLADVRRWDGLAPGASGATSGPPLPADSIVGVYSKWPGACIRTGDESVRPRSHAPVAIDQPPAQPCWVFMALTLAERR